jgi:hypothetical protein
LLEVETQLAVLARVRRHLATGGVFAFDVFDPKPEGLTRESEPAHLAASFEDNGRPK